MAVAVPTLIAFNVPPSATFFNQAASFVGWGLARTVVAATLAPRDVPESAGSLETMLIESLPPQLAGQIVVRVIDVSKPAAR